MLHLRFKKSAGMGFFFVVRENTKYDKKFKINFRILSSTLNYLMTKINLWSFSEVKGVKNAEFYISSHNFSNFSKRCRKTQAKF